MPDLNRYHPAVEAASKAWGDSAPTTTAMWAGMSEHRRDLVRGRMAEAFKGALPHLTADDLRDTDVAEEIRTEGWMQGWAAGRDLDGDEDAIPYLRHTPAGRALKAEAWEEAVLRYARGSAETRRVLASVLPNPYRDGDA